jgi:hypothetical protein
MKFLILASLFVLSVVANPEAEAEAEPQHFTFGLVQHPNGAITPDDTDSVKAVKALHANAKLDAYAFNYAKGFSHMPNVYQNDYMPKVYQNDYMPEVYSGRYYNNYYSGMPTYATNPFTMSINLRFLALYIGLLLSMVLVKEMLKPTLRLTPRLNHIITTVILGLPLIFHLAIVIPMLIDLLATPTPTPKMPIHTWKMPCPLDKLCNP